jgi:hypothetical protein
LKYSTVLARANELGGIIQTSSYTLEQILKMLEEGKVSMSHEVMTEGKWQTLDELVPKTIPPPLPPAPSASVGGSAPNAATVQDSFRELNGGAVDIVRTRPASVVTLGVLNIVFASLALLAVPFGLFGLIAMLGQTPILYILYLAITLLLDLLLKVGLLVFGIGLLKKAEWARGGCIIYAWCALALVCIDFVVALIFFALSRPAQHGPMVATLVAVRLIITALAVVYPVILLVFMGKPKVVNYFEG